MTATPITFHWDGECMTPVGRFAAVADKVYVVGENYTLEVVQQRSAATHRHFFACINEAWANLPELHAGRWHSPDHLRKWALVQAGFRNETTYIAHSKAEAMRFAAFARSIDGYAVVQTDGNLVAIYTAKSQSEKAMTRKEFQASKEAVLDVLSKLLGVTSDELSMSRRPRKYIPLPERLASALADKLPQEQRDQLRAAKVPAKAIIRLFTPDHNILHTHGGADKWWNITMRERGPELKAKDGNDTRIAAKVKRLRGETCTGPRQKIAQRADGMAEGRANCNPRAFERRP
jgi:hypothetical protein